MEFGITFKGDIPLKRTIALAKQAGGCRVQHRMVF